MDVLARNNVTIAGNPAGRPMLFAHGYGCDQNMWRHMIPVFEQTYRIIAFDHVGAGGSDLTAFSRGRYASLAGYAEDVLEICEALDLHDVVVVGHSVSAMIGVLAINRSPERFGGLIMIGPSPRYINDGDYVGGFSAEDIEEMLEALDSNYLGWSTTMAPAIMGNSERPALGEELTNSFCRTDPAIARHFARVAFMGDNRDDLAGVSVPTLILQCSDDVIAPGSVGAYTHEHIPGSTLVELRATGHCPHLSAPEETAEAISSFLPQLQRTS